MARGRRCRYGVRGQAVHQGLAVQGAHDAFGTHRTVARHARPAVLGHQLPHDSLRQRNPRAALLGQHAPCHPQHLRQLARSMLCAPLARRLQNIHPLGLAMPGDLPQARHLKT